MADKKANASLAFQDPQLVPRKPSPLQSNVRPQLPSSQLMISPKATNQQTEMTRSVGQWINEPEKGNSQRMDKRIESAATTSM